VGDPRSGVHLLDFQPRQSTAIVRFLVGQDEEKAIVRLNQKLAAHLDLIPPGASHPLVKPRSIDDVPILALTFWSKRYGDFELRRIAAQVDDTIKQTPDVSAVALIGGQRREIRITFESGAPGGLQSIARSGRRSAGSFPIAVCPQANSRAATSNFSWRPGSFCARRTMSVMSLPELPTTRPIFVRDVAEVSDGGEEPSQYVRYSDGNGSFPAVTVAVSKRKSTNAVTVAEEVLSRVARLRGSVIPSDVEMTVTRNYGDTAKEKSNELLYHMLIAVISVSVLIAIVLGFRESLIVFTAIPVTLALTLTVFYVYGYTLNRITLFALIFSIGILVDDAIVVVENIARHWRMPDNQARPLFEVAVEAVDEVGNPTILATLAVVAAILPMAFVGGLAGPYMRPIPIGASAAMLFSLLVAFIVTPWAAVRILKSGSVRYAGEREAFATRLYRRVMGALLHRPLFRWSFVGGVVTLLVASCALLYTGFVKVKMLPFDNKSEFQVIVDMPNGTTLEQSARVGATARRGNRRSNRKL
jgi:multidrug efflux pump subunit AcrB